MAKRSWLLSVGVLLLVFSYCSDSSSPDRSRPTALVFDDGFYSGVPLSERDSAWGATDPSWSADGSEIAFSLFGSLWVMPAAGGEARQLTASAGYDAGASWSPDGRKLAFVRGREPIRGVQIGAVGTLTVLDLSSGKETPLASAMQFVGTPAWTPDSSALIVSQTERNEALLYRVPVDGAAAARLTSPAFSRVTTTQERSSGWFTYWHPAAVHPAGNEIAFADDRDGTPQLWRMPLRDGLVITRKLTRYAETDQADIQGLTWTGQDSLIFSNNLNSGRTNYDLWRWKAGDPPEVERLTSTITDEFSPAISPGGQTVLFVSNHLGNLDLFTTTPEMRQARHLKIESLRFQEPAATLAVRIRNEAGERIGARISVRASDGKYYTPRGALYRYNGSMGDNAGFFHATGDFELTAPAGRFQIAAYHGMEYDPVELISSPAPGQRAEVEIKFKRFTHWQGDGWWSGEDHIHANYAGPYYLRPEDALAMIEAEDLNVANMLAANAEGTRAYDSEFFEGGPHPLSNEKRILYWNEEYRNRIVYGHMAILNLLQLTDPMYTSFAGTPHPYDYPSNTMVARSARDDGAVVAYVHPIVGPTSDPFDFTVSAKELPVTAALGYVDIIDIYPWGPVSREIWYRLLNCGFRIAPGAGTDTFSNWRSLNRVPGQARAYVRAEGPLTYSSWISGLKRGRNFVTSGPLISMTVNGKEPGDTVTTALGEPLAPTVIVKVESRVPLDLIELVLNGEVVASKDAGKARKMEWTWQGNVNQSGWIAARVSGAPDPAALGMPAEAHTGAVYLHLAGEAMRPLPGDAALFVDWIDRLWDLVELRDNFENPSQKEQVRELVMKARKFYAGHAMREL